MPLAQYMQHILGEQHVVSTLVLKAAEANLSSSTRARRQEQRKLQEVQPASLQVLQFPASTSLSLTAGQPGEASDVSVSAWLVRTYAPECFNVFVSSHQHDVQGLGLASKSSTSC